MQTGNTSAARGWLHTLLAGLATSGWLALFDGWFQPSGVSPMLRLPVMAFSVLGAWALVGSVLAVTALFLRAKPLKPTTGMALGVFVGVAPWLHAYLHFGPGPVAVALAHSSSLLLALLVLWIGRPGFSFRWSAGLVLIPAGVLLIAWLMPGHLPSLRSADAQEDARRLAEFGARPVPPAGAPDLVLISVDTLRADALFADPARPAVLTAPAPFIAELRASQALWSPYALSSSDQTLPGHVGMLSGLDAMGHGVRHNLESPASEIRFLAQDLRDAGYRTAATITNGLIGPITGMDRGYDLHSEEPIALATFGMLLVPWLNDHSWIGRCTPQSVCAMIFGRLFFRDEWNRRAEPQGARTLRAAEAQLAELLAEERPFFQFVHFMDPHTDYLPPAEYRGRLAGEFDAAGAGLPDGNSPIQSAHLTRIEEGLASTDPAAAAIARAAAEHCHLVYLEDVMYVDACIARYVAAVQRSGRPTIFLLTGDHGEMFGEHGLMEHANGLWEENLRVPFLLWGAGIPAGELAWVPQLQDVAPTLLTAAGMSIPPAMTGASVVAPADGVAPNGSRAPTSLIPAPAPVRGHSAAQQEQVTVRTGTLKWMGRWTTDTQPPVTWRAFDLALDPFEQKTISPASAPISPEVQQTLARDTWPQRLHAAIGAAQAALARQLGYVRD